MKYFIYLCGFYFVITLASQLHGFSMASWNSVFENADFGKPLVGSPRNIRCDDWMAQIPMVLSQGLILRIVFHR